MPARAEIRNGAAGWHPFGLTDDDFEQAPDRGGVKCVNVKLGSGGSPDRSGVWLRGAMAALAVLAVAAAAVSWEAQYVLVASVKHAPAIAALEAGIPDVGAVIFAALGLALALHGKRAIRARALNVACVGISLAMNALAAGHGWRDLAIWVMPSSVYAAASDTLIGVIRAWALAGPSAQDSQSAPAHSSQHVQRGPLPRQAMYAPHPCWSTGLLVTSPSSQSADSWMASPYMGGG